MSKKVNFIFKRILLGEEPRKGEFMGSVFSPTDSWVVYNSFLFVEDEFWTTPASSMFKFKLLKEAHFCRPFRDLRWMVMEGSSHALPQFLLNHSTNEWSSFQVVPAGSQQLFLELPQLTGQLFLCFVAALCRCPHCPQWTSGFLWRAWQLFSMVF